MNGDAFPLRDAAVILNSPPWDWAFGIPRVFNSLARRLGWRDSVAGFKARYWRPQLLHAHFGTRGWDGLPLKRRLKVPLLTSFYGYDAWMLPASEPLWRERYRELFAEGEAFLVEGPAMGHRLVSLGCPPNKVRIHRIGVDLDSLPFEPKSLAEGLRILMVGRFVEKKGLLDGLRACALVRARGVSSSVTIVGDALDSDAAGQRIKQALQALAGQTELAGSVRLTGFLPLDQTRALFKTHNVFLAPSKHAASGDAEGGSPVVLTEAMASGLFCIGTRHCDIPEVILDGQTGLLCEEGDVEGIAGMLAAVRGSVSRFAALTIAGRKHVEESYSLATQLGRMGEIYAGLVSYSGQASAKNIPVVVPSRAASPESR